MIIERQFICYALRNNRPTFPSTCLSPDQPGYGQVVANGTGRRRARRNTQPVAPIASAPVPIEQRGTSWTVMTGAPGTSASYGGQASYSPQHTYHPSDPHGHARAHPPATWRHPSTTTHSPSMASASRSPSMVAPVSNSTAYRDLPQSSRSRYSPYPTQATVHRKHSGSSVGSPSIDIPAMSIHDRHTHAHPHARHHEQFNLPPIQTGNIQPRGAGGNFTQPPYALPPISTLEHSRTNNSLSSAEVLRRLRMDDNLSNQDRERNEERARARSMSTSIYK